MSEGEATWPASSVSLISGEHDAVLIDALLTPEDAGRIVDWIKASGKNLTTIYITHGHGDHFFGLNTILQAFPSARPVTAPAVVPEAKGQTSPEGMQFWNALFPGQVPQHPVVPQALETDVIDLEGHELRIITVGQSDTSPSTIVHIPSLEAVIAGDVAYNGIHQWLAQTDHEKRMRWIASVEQIEALQPKIVVAGHKRPEAPDDNPATILGDTKTYIRDFNNSLSASDSAQELVDKMMVLHGELGNPYTLWTAAQSVFEQGQGRSSRAEEKSGGSPMNDLLKVAIEAHGGLERWNQLNTVSARLIQGGVLWPLKGQVGVLDDVVITASLHEEKVSHRPFGAADRRSAFTPKRVAIETDDGTVLEALDQPRASFAGHTAETPWSTLQLAYFVGTAMWTYLTQPFVFTLPGFQTTELDPWEEAGQQWRRLRVAWPSHLATHCTEQTLYFTPDGLLARHDYDVEISGNANAAHYVSDYKDVAGIRLPTKHRIFPRTPDGQSLAEPLLVSIRLSEISFT